MSTQIHATIDALENPTAFYLTGGQACDFDGADALPDDIRATTILADKGYDVDMRVLEQFARAGKTVLIPPRRSRKDQRLYDKHLYQARHLIENFFGKLKHFRAIGTHYDKTACNFLAAIHLAGASIWLT